MPWTAAQFKSRHNKKLSPAQAHKAARIASAMVRGGAPEGVAIATANKRAKTLGAIARKANRERGMK